MEPSSEDEAQQPAATFEHVVATLHELVPSHQPDRWINALARLVVDYNWGPTDDALCAHDLVSNGDGLHSETTQRLCGQDKAHQRARLRAEAPPLVREVCEGLVRVVCETLTPDPHDFAQLGAAEAERAFQELTAWPAELEHEVVVEVRVLLQEQWLKEMLRRHGEPEHAEEDLPSEDTFTAEELEFCAREQALHDKLCAGDISLDEYIAQCAGLAWPVSMTKQ